MELAKAYFCQAVKLNPNNIRALYGLLLVSFKMILYIILDSSYGKLSVNNQFVISDNKQYCNIT